MTTPIPTEGIEPTIRRIAREEVDRAMRAHVNLRHTPVIAADPAQAGAADQAGSVTAHAVRSWWDGLDTTDTWTAMADEINDRIRKVNADWCSQVHPAPISGPEELRPWMRRVRLAEEERLAKERDAAVHQARVDALREAGLSLDYSGAMTSNLVKQWLHDRADRLEREQAKTAGAKENDGTRRMAGVSSPVAPAEAKGTGFSARMSNAPSLPPDGPDEPEAKGAPEQMPEHAFLNDARISVSAQYPGKKWGYTRDDVVERRVAEAVLRACRRIAADLGDENGKLAIRVHAEGSIANAELNRVVAERDDLKEACGRTLSREDGERKRADAAESERDAARLAVEETNREVMRERRRAESAEARVRELEAELSHCLEERGIDVGNAVRPIESELARVRAELAEFKNVAVALAGASDAFKALAMRKP